jgi:Zn-dependent peptidase ImmA (M78 family)
LDFVGMSDRDQEKAADRFAGAFLMAKEMVFGVLGQHRTSISLGELVELKKLFRVSVAAVVVRCNQLGVISRSVYSRIWSQIRLAGWNGPRSTEPLPLEPEIPQRMERMSLRAVAEGIISESKAAELLRISVRDLDRLMMPAGA